MKSESIGASVGLGILVFLLVLAIIGVILVKKYLKTLKGHRNDGKLGPCISSRHPPEFVIPPYTLLSNGSDGTATPVSENEEMQPDVVVGKTPPLAVRRSLSMPAPSALSRARQAMILTPSDEGEMAASWSTKEVRPQYRRTVSHFTPLSPPTMREPKKKVSIAPYGKLEVSLQYVSTKKLLFVQVNGAFDLPHVRLSGVSTPYVRVHMLPKDSNAETRSFFLNLATNRICMFDQLTLVEAQNCTLKFVVLDYDKFSRSEFVAEVMMSLLHVDLLEGTTLSRHLISKTISDSGGKGSLTVSLCQNLPAGSLHVTILKAMGLPPPKSDPTPASGGLDTVVKVLCCVHGKVIERKKTKVIKKSSSPIFNETFVFTIREEELRHSSVTCEVYGGDTVLKTEKIGYISLGLESFGTEVRQWNDMMMSPLKWITETHLLHT